MEKSLSIQEILEIVFTTENPETGSQPPEKIAWVIFENETICLITPKGGVSEEASFEDLQDFAKKELQILGEAVGGTPSADFNVSRVPWFQEEFVYMISYNSNFIFNIGVYTEEKEDIGVGIFARSARSQDAVAMKVKLIRNFEKEVKSFE